MNCLIYKGRSRPDTYVYIEDRGDESSVPEQLSALMGELEFVMQLEIGAGTRLARARAEDVVEQITVAGYYLQLPPVV